MPADNGGNVTWFYIHPLRVGDPIRDTVLLKLNIKKVSYRAAHPLVLDFKTAASHAIVSDDSPLNDNLPTYLHKNLSGILDFT